MNCLCSTCRLTLIPGGWSANRKLPSDRAVYDTGFAILSSVNHSPILLGTSSFTATGWQGSFYPKGLRPTDYLSYYAQHFDTVEIDSVSSTLRDQGGLKVPASTSRHHQRAQSVTEHPKDIGRLQDCLRKSVVSRIHSSGWSSHGRWPAWFTTSQRAWGIIDAISRPRVAGPSLS